MKVFFSFLLIIPWISLSQNIQIDSCGLDNSARLNRFEVDYFKIGLGHQNIDTRALSDYRILFLSGNLGIKASSKQHFFESSGKVWFSENDFPSMELIVLTNEEQKRIPEYDAILVTWSKIKCTEKMRKRFLANAINHASQTDK